MTRMTWTTRERPREGRFTNGRSIKKCLEILSRYIRHSKDRLITMEPLAWTLDQLQEGDGDCFLGNLLSDLG